jgi:hypothetical protein
MLKTPVAFRTEDEYLAHPPRPEWERSNTAALRLYWLLLLLIAIFGSVGTSIYHHRYLLGMPSQSFSLTTWEILMPAGFGLALVLPLVQLGVAVLTLVVIGLAPAAYFPVKGAAMNRILILTGWMIAGTLAGTGIMALFLIK